MDNYRRIIYSVTIGRKDIPKQKTRTFEELSTLLEDLSKKIDSTKYCFYIAEFPCYHIAIDNKSGTRRLFSLYNEEDIEKFLKKNLFYE